MTDGLQMLARKKQFSCVHRYEVGSWDSETNRKTFGACYSPHGHGHNYTLEAWYAGPLDPETGMIVNLTVVDEMLNTVTSELDGKNLNRDVEHFASLVPTTENLLMFLKDRLIRQLNNSSKVHLQQLRLYESDDLWVDWVKQ